MVWRWLRYAGFGRYWGIGGARGHFRRAPWSGDFRRPKLAERKNRASDVSKYLSTYVSVEKIAKSRKKNVTARTGIKLVPLKSRGRFHFHSKGKMWNGISQFHDTWNLEYSTGIGIELAGTNHTSLRRNSTTLYVKKEIRQGVAPVPRKG